MNDPIYHLTINMVVITCIYLFVALAVLRFLRDGVLRDALFALLNVMAFYFLFFHDISASQWLPEWDVVIKFFSYLLFGIIHWLIIRKFVVSGSRHPRGYYAALMFPIMTLVVVKIETAWHLIGFSYMAFRMAQAVLELRKEQAETCGLWSYLGFLYFPFTIAVGPINPYLTYKKSLIYRKYDWEAAALGVGRILTGFIKLRLLAMLAFQLSFSSFWLDGFFHNSLDFLICSFAFFLYMYLNFSGACDIVIGAAAILNIRVKENFNNPFLSTNIRDFWNRWHISLSEFARNLIFTPIYINVTRSLGLAWALPASLLAAMLTFLVIGLWHGFQSGFLYFGLWHGVGFCIHILWEAGMKKMPKSIQEKLYTALWFRFISIIITLTFVALSMIFVELPASGQRDKVYAAYSSGW